MVAGKTTLLRHLLENTKLKIGCIVNDVATVNIDAKLIRNDRSRDRDQNNNTTSDLADTIELANGCACKSALYTSNQRSIAAVLDLTLLTLQAAALQTSCSVPLSNC